MEFFDGLFPYEIILLLLGVLLFLVLLFAFVFFIVRGKPYGKLFVFFAIPVVMVGFPGIRSVEISDSLLKIERKTAALQKDPTDAALRDTLAQEVAAVSMRPLVSPRASVTLARAQLALGNGRDAEAKVESALKKAPRLPGALEVKKRIELDRELSALTSQVERNPDDTAAKARLTSAVRKVTPVKVANPETLTTIARAQTALGEREKARENLETVLRINPKLAPALQLERKLRPLPGGGDSR